MPTRIAVLADTHLTDLPNTAQDAALDWALEWLRADPPDLVLVAGDVTAAGTTDAARRAREKLNASGLTFRMAPGNSDCRSPQHWERVRELLTAPGTFVNHECAALLLDAAEPVLPDGQKTAIDHLLAVAGTRRVVLGCHFPLSSFAQADRAWLTARLASGAISLFVAGHKHLDSQEAVGPAAAHLVRGLDPDKAKSAPPAIALFELSDRRWSRSDIAFPGGDAATWPQPARDEFLGHLGISCMSDTLAGLEQAAARGLAVVELRAGKALATPADALRQSVERWRAAGGGHLSVHMPNLRWDAAAAGVEGLEAWQAALNMAVELKANALTCHVPRIAIGRMQPWGEAWQCFAQVYCDSLAPALDAGMAIGIENMHMNPGETADESRGFGYLPEECLAWIQSLRHASGGDRIGLLLDIGHARNNQPFATHVTLGQWYALAGAEAVGYHIHQVAPTDGRMTNHHPFANIFGPLLSLSSFFWAWGSGQLRHAPMFLEVRSQEQGWESLDLLTEHIQTSVPTTGRSP